MLLSETVEISVLNNNKKYLKSKGYERKLVEKMGGDPNKSGSQIMNEMGHYKIWSCGQLRFEFNVLKL